MSITGAQTRERIAAIALDLFEARGYAETTTVQIAAAAGVSEMTLFRHFASKDRLLLDDPYDPVIAAAVADQPQEMSPIERVTAGVRAAWRALPEPAENLTRRRLRIAAATPGLIGAIRANTRTTEAAVARALAATGTDPTAARIAAAAVLAALMESLTAWASALDDTTLSVAVERALRILDEAVSA